MTCRNVTTQFGLAAVVSVAKRKHYEPGFRFAYANEHIVVIVKHVPLGVFGRNEVLKGEVIRVDSEKFS